MSQEEYTTPPGFRVSGAGGTKLAPVLIDPAAPASEGDVITRVGAGYAPAASGGGSGAIFLSENNLGDGLLDANETFVVAWADGWTVFNEGGFSVPGGAPTRLALPSAGVYEVFAHGIVAPQVSNELVELVVSIVGENLGPDFTGAQILALALDGSVPFVWRAFEKFPANALVGVSIQAGTHAAAITGLHVGIHREVVV
jgi:hypothetical protein